MAKRLAIGAANAYIRAMAFFRNVSPTGAVKDFAQVWNANPYRWRVLGLAMITTFTMLYFFIPDDVIVPPEKPQITYITTFEPGRTDAQIMASNIEHQKQQDALRALEAEREEAKKELYRQIGKATFIDTDAIERDIAREKAAEEAAAEAAREAARARTVADR